MNASLRRAFVLAPAFLLAPPALGQDEATPESGSVLEQLDHAVLDGKWWLRLRYRLEHVDQDGIAGEAWASTLRTVLGYESAPWRGASVVLEFEDVSNVGNVQYDSTTNGEDVFPVVADPNGAEVNQAHLKFVPAEEATLRLGRQVVRLDNLRFVGDVGWRQNQQTYDAAAARWTPLEELELFYAYVDNVNRVFGDDSPVGDHRMGSHLFNAGYDVQGYGKLSGYAYLLDYDTADALSSNTLGLRFAGSHAVEATELLYAAEFAKQKDAGDNQNDLDQDYVLGELGAKVSGFTLKAGKEVLGGSGTAGDAFQTPLATLHAFNGWADKFLSIPDTGLEDFYVALAKTIDEVTFQLAWHDFQADTGGAEYGTELDASLTWRAAKSLVLGLKLADYQADDFATDTTKAWFWLGYSP